jgi:1-aminocyclopropane-1-carboxylate deaminase/D-cysteine desulfhydrase-like pyridoxal-dependent ACC family enzyme
MTIVLNKPVLQPLHDPLFEKKNLDVFVLRDDMIHPYIAGNKWRKLKYNLEEFRKKKKEYFVTFGGAYSNHIVATAAAGKESGIKTIGVIRGEEHTTRSNAVLRFAEDCGMELIFVTREKYRLLRKNNSLVHELFVCARKERTTGSQLFIVPEGGSNESAVKGCKEIIDDIPVDFDYACCACGTGTTLAGIAQNLNGHQQVVGIAVLKNASFIDEAIRKYTGCIENYQLIHDYHFGGYAKSTEELELFCKSFAGRSHIPVEPVYTGKLFFAIYDLARKDFFEKGKTVVAIHTGGVYDFNTTPDPPKSGNNR